MAKFIKLSENVMLNADNIESIALMCRGEHPRVYIWFVSGKRDDYIVDIRGDESLAEWIARSEVSNG